MKFVLLMVFLTCSFADASIPKKIQFNPFCEFEPYNRPVIPLQDYMKYKRMTPTMKLKYLRHHMWKQCGYIPKGSLDHI